MRNVVVFVFQGSLQRTQQFRRLELKRWDQKYKRSAQKNIISVFFFAHNRFQHHANCEERNCGTNAFCSGGSSKFSHFHGVAHFLDLLHTMFVA